jgi:hypothetical protein
MQALLRSYVQGWKALCAELAGRGRRVAAGPDGDLIGLGIATACGE